MKIYLGETGLNKTWQLPFELTTKCVHCGGNAEIMMVGQEAEENKGEYACDLKETTGEKGGLWLHDACAIAVYLCRDCLEATTIINQA